MVLGRHQGSWSKQRCVWCYYQQQTETICMLTNGKYYNFINIHIKSSLLISEVYYVQGSRTNKFCLICLLSELCYEKWVTSYRSANSPKRLKQQYCKVSFLIKSTTRSLPSWDPKQKVSLVSCTIWVVPNTQNSLFTSFYFLVTENWSTLLQDLTTTNSEVNLECY